MKQKFTFSFWASGLFEHVSLGLTFTSCLLFNSSNFGNTSAVKLGCGIENPFGSQCIVSLNVCVVMFSLIESTSSNFWLEVWDKLFSFSLSNQFLLKSCSNDLSVMIFWGRGASNSVTSALEVWIVFVQSAAVGVSGVLGCNNLFLYAAQPLVFLSISSRSSCSILCNVNSNISSLLVFSLLVCRTFLFVLPDEGDTIPGSAWITLYKMQWQPLTLPFLRHFSWRACNWDKCTAAANAPHWKTKSFIEDLT